MSQRVKRPILQYESRILQLLQGHPSIPALYGYGQLPHFECLAMELLGPSVKDCATGRVAVRTVVRVVLQMVCVAIRLHPTYPRLPETCHSFPPWIIHTNMVSFIGILSPRMCFPRQQTHPGSSSLILVFPVVLSLVYQPGMIR